jgi:CRISPR-associated protein Cmr6
MSEPVPLVRKALRDALKAANNAHPGLLLQRGWTDYVKTDSNNEGTGGKGKHIERICAIPTRDFYENAYRRWLKATEEVTRFSHVAMKIEGRLLIGLTGGGALETGCAVSHTYGVPYLPGSSIKGVVRAYAQKVLGNTSPAVQEIFGTEPTDAEKQGLSGLIGFHDAWWIPGSGGAEHKDHSFTEDIVTPHHPDYYAGGKAEATDLDSPVPNSMIGVRGSFLFTLEGPPEWLKIAHTLLGGALAENGIGAKTRAGYGYLVPDNETNQRLANEAAHAKRVAMPVAERLKAEADVLTEKQIAEQFGKDLNKTKKKDDFDLYVAAVRERHGNLIDGWAGENKDSNKYKTYRFFAQQRGGE